jgi:hypothetical protein
MNMDPSETNENYPVSGAPLELVGN